MLNQAIAFVVETIFDLFILSALVRFWMQALRAPARNPLAQFTMALTDFAVKPLRRLVPGLWGLDLASLAVAWVAEVAAPRDPVPAAGRGAGERDGPLGDPLPRRS